MNFKNIFYCVWVLNIILIFFSIDHMIFRFSLTNFVISTIMGIGWLLEFFLLPKEKRFKL